MDAAAVSRPYAAAIFSLAREQNTIGKWQEALQRFTTAFQTMTELAAGNLLDIATQSEVLLQNAETDEQKKFITLLAENARLSALPHIAERFEGLRLDDAGIVRVRVESAVAINDKKEFDKLLAKRFDKKVETTYEEVPELLGGVRIYVRDDVIDDSLLGRRNKLSAALV